MHRHIFPLEFQKMLVVKHLNYEHLAKAMARRGHRLSKQFICMIATGTRPVPVGQLKKICESMELTEVERQRLHRAVCLDDGFEIGQLDA